MCAPVSEGSCGEIGPSLLLHAPHTLHLLKVSSSQIVKIILVRCSTHYEIWKYCRSTSKVHAQVLQNLGVPRPSCLQLGQQPPQIYSMHTACKLRGKMFPSCALISALSLCRKSKTTMMGIPTCTVETSAPGAWSSSSPASCLNPHFFLSCSCLPGCCWRWLHGPMRSLSCSPSLSHLLCGIAILLKAPNPP